MSWIGPAPHSPQVIASLAEDQLIILRARPGLITMWRYLPSSASVGEAFQSDVDSVLRHWAFGKDLLLLFKATAMVLRDE